MGTNSITKFYVRFKKKWKWPDGKIYQEDSGFCIKDLYCEAIKRRFENEYTIVEEMVVKERRTKKIIYKGNNYDEYIKAADAYYLKKRILKWMKF